MYDFNKEEKASRDAYAVALTMTTAEDIYHGAEDKIQMFDNEHQASLKNWLMGQR